MNRSEVKAMCIKAIPVRLRSFVAFAGLALASSFCAAAEWKPDKNVEIITGASAGGGNDRLARTIQRIWKEERLVAVTVLPVNRPGGGNALSWNYLNQHPGDGHYIAIANPNLVTNHLTGRNAQHYTARALAETLAHQAQLDLNQDRLAQLLEATPYVLEMKKRVAFTLERHAAPATAFHARH